MSSHWGNNTGHTSKNKIDMFLSHPWRCDNFFHWNELVLQTSIYQCFRKFPIFIVSQKDVVKFCWKNIIFPRFFQKYLKNLLHKFKLMFYNCFKELNTILIITTRSLLNDDWSNIKTYLTESLEGPCVKHELDWYHGKDPKGFWVGFEHYKFLNMWSLRLNVCTFESKLNISWVKHGL
jgi:hypothetical protein